MGAVKQWYVKIPELSRDIERRVYLYLPDSYDTSDNDRFPVMYMFDGHNVFFDEDATYGKSWGMYDYMNETNKHMIIVAVACNPLGNARLEEYSPINFEYCSIGSIRGRGEVYMNWLTHTLKPYIDSNWRTLPDRNNTIICGSSMGGLMALYAVTKYNQYFQRAACLSPSIWIDPEQILSLLSAEVISEDTVIYMDYGSKELPNHEQSEEALFSAARLLLQKNAKPVLRFVPDGDHSETSWERQIPIFMECLGVV